MKLPRRTFLHLATGAAALPVVSQIAMAQTYPSQPVRIIVGFAAGGPNDILARLIGQWLSERLGQPFIIENRLGVLPKHGKIFALWTPKAGRTVVPGGGTIAPGSVAILGKNWQRAILFSVFSPK